MNLENFPEYLKMSPIEIFGALTGLIYISLSIKQNILLWPVGIISSAVYIWVFFVSKLYADMSLQVYYLIIGFYGWYVWQVNKKSHTGSEKRMSVSRTSRNEAAFLSFLTVVLWILLYFILKRFTDSDVPLADSGVTAFAITATWMLARKKIEQWIVWIFVNSASVALFFYKNLYATVLLYAVLAVLAWSGYKSWKRELVAKENVAHN